MEFRDLSSEESQTSKDNKKILDDKYLEEEKY
jgi:hypothetical protein